MTESIQKKLLRVRPPRVRITYDVEIGGAIEKTELPFIVGIFADLSNDRDDAAPPLPALKDRKMLDIDRDNFNDVMKSIGPRASLVKIPKQEAIADLHKSGNAADLNIVFSSLDDFDPLSVVNALPSLKKKYLARGLIRSLQTKAESEDAISDGLDQWVDDKDPDHTAQFQTTILSALSDGTIADKPTLKKALFGLQQSMLSYQAAVAADDNGSTPATKADKKTAETNATTVLQRWMLAVSNSDDFTASCVHGSSLANALAKEDTPDNRKSVNDLVKTLKDVSVQSDESSPAQILSYAQRTKFQQKLGMANIPAMLVIVDKRNMSGDANDPSWAPALLLLGLVATDDQSEITSANYIDPSEYQEDFNQSSARETALLFANYLYNAPTSGTDDRSIAAIAILPLVVLIQGKQPGLAAAYALLRLKYFGSQVLINLQSKNKHLLQVLQQGATALIDEQVVLFDQQLSAALSLIMHSDNFKAAEQTWRGLSYLVFNTETSTKLKLRVFNATKDELRKDMDKAVEFDQSALFKMVYEAEYGTYGGYPYSLLIGGYEIENTSADMSFIKNIAGVAASAHAPFIAAASAQLFGLPNFDKLDKPRDLAKIFEAQELEGWREFRDMEDARYVTLVLPRVLLRLPYGSPEKRNTTICEGLNFEEDVGGDNGAPTFSLQGDIVSYPIPDNDNFLWGNAAYMLAQRITNAFSLHSWTAAIRGVEGGGLVENLPLYTYTSDSGTTELFCPTEVSITDRREKELNDLGFISLCHRKGTGTAVFFGGQTTNLPKKYFSDEANSNARISSMLPYMLAASRFAHYIKVIMRDKIGSFMTRGNVESFLNSWISNYVLLDDNATPEIKASYPLRAGAVVVTEVPGEPGAYKATAFLRPHFQLEELTVSIRLVANLPK